VITDKLIDYLGEFGILSGWEIFLSGS